MSKERAEMMRDLIGFIPADDEIVLSPKRSSSIVEEKHEAGRKRRK